MLSRSAAGFAREAASASDGADADPERASAEAATPRVATVAAPAPALLLHAALLGAEGVEAPLACSRGCERRVDSAVEPPPRCTACPVRLGWLDGPLLFALHARAAGGDAAGGANGPTDALSLAVVPWLTCGPANGDAPRMPGFGGDAVPTPLRAGLGILLRAEAGLTAGTGGGALLHSSPPRPAGRAPPAWTAG